MINLSRSTIAALFSISNYPQIASLEDEMQFLENTVNPSFNHIIIAKNVSSIYNIFNVLFALCDKQDTDLVYRLLMQIKELASKQRAR